MKRVIAGEAKVAHVAAELGVAHTTVKQWAANPEYGGDPNRLAAESPLPVERAPAKRAYTKSKSKHEINFCPRCGLNLKG